MPQDSEAAFDYIMYVADCQSIRKEQWLEFVIGDGKFNRNTKLESKLVRKGLSLPNSASIASYSTDASWIWFGGSKDDLVSIPNACAMTKTECNCALYCRPSAFDTHLLKAPLKSRVLGNIFNCFDMFLKFHCFQYCMLFIQSSGDDQLSCIGF